MERIELEKILQLVASGDITPDEALVQVKIEPFTDLGYAKVDHHRSLRKGIAEVIYGQGKTADQIMGICQSMIDSGQERILVTRLDGKTARKCAKKLPLTYHETSHVGIIGEMPKADGIGTLIVAAAGTSDLAVAEEAALTAELFGNKVLRLYDVGVAGIHRLFTHTQAIMEANVIIAVAGMEGALPSVIAGIAECPVIAVPTSVGYGASFGGVAALLAMLNSCASGVSVVNIDNGFGAAYQASLINHRRDCESV